MKASAILGAILFAWISGIGASDESGNTNAQVGAVIFLGLALICGWLAWRMT